MTWWSWLLVALAVSLVTYALFVGLLVVAGRRDDARAFATLVPDCIVLVGRLVRDPRVPRRRKAFPPALPRLLRPGGGAGPRSAGAAPPQGAPARARRLPRAAVRSRAGLHPRRRSARRRSRRCPRASQPPPRRGRAAHPR